MTAWSALADGFDLVHVQTPFRAHYAGLAAGRAAGVPVVDRCFDDLIHGFYNIGITRPTLLAAHEINRTIAAALAGNSAPD